MEKALQAILTDESARTPEVVQQVVFEGDNYAPWVNVQ